jgi:hypothetical protein
LVSFDAPQLALNVEKFKCFDNLYRLDGFVKNQFLGYIPSHLIWTSSSIIVVQSTEKIRFDALGGESAVKTQSKSITQIKDGNGYYWHPVDNENRLSILFLSDNRLIFSVLRVFLPFCFFADPISLQRINQFARND